MKQKRLKEIIAYIKANPEHWSQARWHCNTSHCVAGFCELKAAGYSLNTRFNYDKFEKLFKANSELARRKLSHLWNTLMGKLYKKKGFNNAGGVNTSQVAREYLDISDEEASYLFDGDRTLAELTKIANTAKFPPYIYRSGQ